jgi:cytochrome c553
MATGKLPLSADVIHDHNAEHQVIPPEEKVSVEFGKHLAGVCTGCHRENLEGGQVASGDPAWPPAQNLTPHADGLQGWTAEQFDTLMRTGKRPDGTEVLFPMTLLIPYTNRLSEVEMAALWAYISSVPPQATGH